MLSISESKPEIILNNSSVQFIFKAEMNKSVVFTLAEKSFILYVENTDIMNQKFDAKFMGITIPICVLSLVLNLTVIRKLRKEEKTTVNQLMLMECMVNIMYSSLGTLQQSPWYRGLDLELYCYPHIVMTFTSVVGNRLLPVGIGLFR